MALDALIYYNVTVTPPVQALSTFEFCGPVAGEIGTFSIRKSALGHMFLGGLNIGHFSVDQSTVSFQGYGGPALTSGAPNSSITLADSSVTCLSDDTISFPGLNSLSINDTTLTGCTIAANQAETVAITNANLQWALLSQTPVEDSSIPQTSRFAITNSTVQSAYTGKAGVLSGVSTHALSMAGVVVNPNDAPPSTPSYPIPFMTNITVTGPTEITNVSLYGAEMRNVDLQGNTLIRGLEIAPPFTAENADPFCGPEDITPCQPSGVTFTGNGPISISCDSEPTPQAQRHEQAQSPSLLSFFGSNARRAAGAGASALVTSNALVPCNPGHSGSGASAPQPPEIDVLYWILGVVGSLSILTLMAYIAYIKLWRDAPGGQLPGQPDLEQPDSLSLNIQGGDEGQPLLGDGAGGHPPAYGSAPTTSNLYPPLDADDFYATCSAPPMPATEANGHSYSQALPNTSFHAGASANPSTTMPRPEDELSASVTA